MKIKVITVFLLTFYFVDDSLCSYNQQRHQRRLVPWNKVPELFRNLVEPKATNLLISEAKGRIADNGAFESAPVRNREPVNDLSSFSGKIKVFFGVLDSKENGEEPSQSPEHNQSGVELVTFRMLEEPNCTECPEKKLAEEQQPQGNGCGERTLTWPIQIVLCNNDTTETPKPRNESFPGAVSHDSTTATTVFSTKREQRPKQNCSYASASNRCSGYTTHFTPVTTPWTISSRTEHTDPANNTYRVVLNNHRENCHSKVDITKTRQNILPHNKDFMIKLPYRIVLKDDDDDQKHDHKHKHGHTDQHPYPIN